MGHGPTTYGHGSSGRGIAADTASENGPIACLDAGGDQSPNPLANWLIGVPQAKPRFSVPTLFIERTKPPLQWPDLTEGRLTPPSPDAQQRRPIFFPCRLTPSFLAIQENPPLLSGP
ncbi:MAG: hypothetical protein PGN21_00505 [Sphingomonas paucimobilis]